MNDEKFIQKRIKYSGDIKLLLVEVCREFFLGKYRSHKVLTIGYEDLNIRLETSTGIFLVKILAHFRDQNSRMRLSQIMEEVQKNERVIAHPKLYPSSQGYLHEVILYGAAYHLFVMQFITGESFYEIGTRPNKVEIAYLARQAALINKLELKPIYSYDVWSITNFIEEYAKAKKYLTRKDLKLINPLVSSYSSSEFTALPHSFVHGDIIDTNVIKDKLGKLWIIDFALANINPRIHELAVLSCNLLFDPKNPNAFEENYHLALDEYQKHIPLEKAEIDLIPICIRIAHSMHIIGATNTMVENNDSDENQYFSREPRHRIIFFVV